MCRLYGFRASEPTKVECALVHAQNALLVQSRGRMPMGPHADGWGVGFYEGDHPEIIRSDLAAFEDVLFSSTAQRVYSTTVVAHVRQASVGGRCLGNTHPFTHACWTFAHNGTVTAFDQVSEKLRQEIDWQLLPPLLGTTDSELVFHWLLSRMAHARINPETPCTEPKTLVRVVAKAISTLAAWSDEAPANEPSKLNFLLTDGRTLIASRWKHTLHWAEIDGIHPCEICGLPHVRQASGKQYRAVVVASEPISQEPWREVPDRSILAISPALRTEIFSLD